jgi:putative acetyltransferase
VKIREENKTDLDAIYTVNLSAFETPAEANLVNVLRDSVQLIISLVADVDGATIGHIMFSPVMLSGHTNLKIMGLAPMAVIPTQQNRGVGSALVKAGLERCRKLDYSAVVVLGHPKYYPRFGFIPSSEFNITSEYEVPDDVFMAMELKPLALRNVSGTIKYSDAFSNV